MPKVLESNVNQIDLLHTIKEEKTSATISQLINDPSKIPGAPQIIDVRSSDGQIIQVNIEDISQFLTYHEVFGKLSNDNAVVSIPNTYPSVPAPLTTSANPSTIQQQINNVIVQPQSSIQKIPSQPGMITPKLENIPNVIPNTTIAGAADASIITGFPGTHTCDICGKSFAFKYQLIVHRRYHSERKPFICQVCGQAFTSTLELTTHGKAHDGNNMFTCNVCYHVFANDASLERHMKRHSTDKPFGCSICQKTFSRKEHLDNHFRSHTGETPFRFVSYLCNGNIFFFK